MVHSASETRKTPRPLVSGTGLARTSGDITLSTPVQSECIHLAWVASGVAMLSMRGVKVPLRMTWALGAADRTSASSLVIVTFTPGSRRSRSLSQDALGSDRTNRFKGIVFKVGDESLE